MLISTLNLEAKALKAFREDPETDSEFEDELNARSQVQAEGGSGDVELESFSGRSNDPK